MPDITLILFTPIGMERLQSSNLHNAVINRGGRRHFRCCATAKVLERKTLKMPEPAKSAPAPKKGSKKAVTKTQKKGVDDFEKFCYANDGPLPLLHRSQPGDWKCPSLSSDSDIRTDCLQYRKYEHGACTGSLKSLKEYSEQLKDMVTFYLGCSFSFEKAVQKAGIPIRNVEQKCNVSMYKTSVPCYSVSMFHCNLVVTMRPIPESKLEAAVLATCELKEAHGAPIHIGDPGLLGIQDLSKPDYGDPVHLHPGDIPVFWACGVTGVEAIINCSAPLAFTHSPGCMFITDLKNDNVRSLGGVPQVHCISQDPLHFSIVSAEAAQKIKTLETLIGIDPGINKNCLPLMHSLWGRYHLTCLFTYLKFKNTVRI